VAEQQPKVFDSQSTASGWAARSNNTAHLLPTYVKLLRESQTRKSKFKLAEEKREEQNSLDWKKQLSVRLSAANTAFGQGLKAKDQQRRRPIAN